MSILLLTPQHWVSHLLLVQAIEEKRKEKNRIDRTERTGFPTQTLYKRSLCWECTLTCSLIHLHPELKWPLSFAFFFRPSGHHQYSNLNKILYALMMRATFIQAFAALFDDIPFNQAPHGEGHCTVYLQGWQSSGPVKGSDYTCLARWKLLALLAML